MFRIYVRFVSLQVFGMIGLSCYILADTFFIARSLGSNGLTSLNLAIPIYSFIHGIGLMIGIGGATRFSILKWNQEKKKRETIFTEAVILVVLAAVLFMGIGLFFAAPFSRLLGADQVTMENTSTYLCTILLISPAFLLNNVLLCFVRNDDRPNLSMAAMLTGSFSNIILDYIFMFPLDMGMFGAALATGLAPMISLMVLSIHFWNKKSTFYIMKTRLYLKTVRDIISLGISSLITEFSSGVVIIIFNTILLGLSGNVGVAAYGVVANLSLVVMSIFTGIAQGIQPIISSSYGKGKIGEIRQTYRYAVITGVIVAAAVYVAVTYFSDSIVSIFNKDKDAALAELAIRGLYLYFGGFLFAGFNIITSMYFNSAKQPKKAFVLSFLRGFAVIVPMAYLLSSIAQMDGVWLAFPVSEAIVFAVAAWMAAKQHRYEKMHSIT